MRHHHAEGPHVVVLGAGYAGLRAALQLDRHARVTLVSRDGHFTERVRLHEAAAGRPEVTHPLAGLLRRTGIERVTARVTRIDPSERTVHTDTGARIGYDRLVHALGSRTAGAAACGESGRTYAAESASGLHQRLRAAPGALSVVGGGATGVEMAAELAESFPAWEVRLLTAGRVAPHVSDRGRDHVRAVLRERGVRVEEGRSVAGPDDLGTDVVVWAASMAPNTEVARAAGLPHDDAGRLLVDPALRSVSHPEIYVAGDAASVRTAASGPVRMACATALPLGRHVADAVARDLRGAEPAPFAFRYQAQCMSLGRHDGLLQLVEADDTPGRRIVTGRPAAVVKEQIVRTTVRVLRLAARSPPGVAPRPRRVTPPPRRTAARAVPPAPHTQPSRIVTRTDMSTAADRTATAPSGRRRAGPPGAGASPGPRTGSGPLSGTRRVSGTTSCALPPGTAGAPEVPHGR